MSVPAFETKSTHSLACTFLAGHCCSLLVKMLAGIMLCYSIAHCKPRIGGVKLLRGTYRPQRNRWLHSTTVALCWLYILSSHTVHGTVLTGSTSILQRTPELTMPFGHDATQLPACLKLQAGHILREQCREQTNRRSTWRLRPQRNPRQSSHGDQRPLRSGCDALLRGARGSRPQ